MAEKDPLTLRIVTPAGLAAETRADSVHLTLADDEKGRGGGDIAILRGHASAVLALGSGPARALRGGRECFRTELAGGFANVKNNVVTVVTEKTLE